MTTPRHSDSIIYVWKKNAIIKHIVKMDNVILRGRHSEHFSHVCEWVYLILKH